MNIAVKSALFILLSSGLSLVYPHSNTARDSI